MLRGCVSLRHRQIQHERTFHPVADNKHVLFTRLQAKLWAVVVQINHLGRLERAGFGCVGTLGDLADSVTLQTTMQGTAAQLWEGAREDASAAALSASTTISSLLGISFAVRSVADPIRESLVVDLERHLATVFMLNL